MPEQQFKRNIAYKFRIGDLLVGKPVMDGERFSFLELGDKHIVRVNVIGNVVDKFDSDNEKKYTFVTIDDGSGQIKLKAFGDDSEKLRNLNQGETILVIGVLRHFNNEVYISPEIVKLQDPKYLLVRKLEIEKNRKEQPQAANAGEQKLAIKDKILEKIKNSEEEGGVYIDKIIMENREASPEIINQEIKKLIEEGIVFEPRPGKVRWLG
jgi:RPA family protein